MIQAFEGHLIDWAVITRSNVQGIIVVCLILRNVTPASPHCTQCVVYDGSQTACILISMIG